MKSLNFEILRNRWPELADLGGFAEKYTSQDPSSALVKLRSFAEVITSDIYDAMGLARPELASFYDLLNDMSFKEVVPSVVVDKLHGIRINGNKAAHGDSISVNTSDWLLKEAFDIGRWFFITYAAGTLSECPKFTDPNRLHQNDTKGRLKRDKKVALQKLAQQEARMEQLLKELDQTRSKAVKAERKADELEALVVAGQGAVDVLKFNEETTRRRLIDSQLSSVGWHVGDNGQSTDDVGQEVEVTEQPTETGIGFADYVLWDDDRKPLAVIEAKRTSKSAELGRKQAALYADSLEKMHGRRPAIFYTNGYDIFLWDDAQGYPPRRLFGFYSKDSLQYLVRFQRSSRVPLDTIAPDKAIIDRFYQVESVKRVTEHFTEKHRGALIVQATGTGKTRVAIALTDCLNRAKWAKRILFLCDRKELRKQAKDSYGEFMSEPLTIVQSRTAKDRDKRIYLATYPAMMRIFQTFDVGFFDLIIADESHRSIYNRYKDLFTYFDCLQVGLTATPIDQVNRNTFRLFGCEEGVPTAHYSLTEAVDEKWLVRFEVYTHTTGFLRSGIKYDDLTEEQKRQLEEDGEEPEQFEFEAGEIDKQIHNKETNRAILRNLMENGIRDKTGQHPGKTIIFARNHTHAVLLGDLFDELYPQYGGSFCQVIDHYDPRAEQLIDDFKGRGTNNDLTIAISVDMLDTGIDVPEIVNLVFAKPVRSKVKFWQMIGRGTRLCKGLFGPGQDKSKFRIFDHWKIFDYFDEKGYDEADASRPKSLMEHLFETRLDLAETALKKMAMGEFEYAIGLVRDSVIALPEESISVREKWREVRSVCREETLNQFSPATVALLRQEIAPLMQWINVRDHASAYEFDLLIAQAQLDILQGGGRRDDYRDKIMNDVNALQKHLNPVRAKSESIKRASDMAFWKEISHVNLSWLRDELRGIMKYRLLSSEPARSAKIIDITDEGIEYSFRPTRLQYDELREFRSQVQIALEKIMEKDPTMQRIRRGETVKTRSIESLVSLVLTQNPGVDLNLLKEFYTETALPLDFLIRSIVGMDPEVVRDRFAEFARRHQKLNTKQVRFLGLLQNHICKHGFIAVDRLYEHPFTAIDSEGLEGVFPDDSEVADLLAIVSTFKPIPFEDRQSK